MDLVLTWRDEATCRHFCDPWIFRPAVEGESTAQHDRRVKIFARYGFNWSDRGYVGNVGQKGRQRDPQGLVAALTKAGYSVTHKGARIPPGLVDPAPAPPALVDTEHAYGGTHRLPFQIKVF